jgi:hypothetical protein
MTAGSLRARHARRPAAHSVAHGDGAGVFGIDNFALRRSRSYTAVVVDAETGGVSTS